MNWGKPATRTVPRILRCSRGCAFCLHVVLPTAIGAAIYLLYRSTHLLVFDWLSACRLLPWVLLARECCAGFQLPDWLLYSLPDGLWVYAVTSWMILIWRRNPPLPWLLVGVVLGCGGELGQIVGLVPGTYQHLDMVFYLVGFGAAYLQLESKDESSCLFCGGAIGHGYLRLWKR